MNVGEGTESKHHICAPERTLVCYGGKVIHRDGKVIRTDQDHFLNMSSASDRSSELVSRLRE